MGYGRPRKTWEPVYNLPAEIDDSDAFLGAGICTGAINANGDCIIAKISNEMEMPVPMDDLTTPPLDFYFIGRDGDLLEIDYDFSIVDWPYISFVADSRALIFDPYKAFLIDTTDGKLIAKYDTANDLGESIAATPVSDDMFMILGDKGVQCYRGSTGEPYDTPPGLGTMFEEVLDGQPYSVVLFSSEKAVYCSDAKSVYEYLPESDQYEQLFSFSELMLGGDGPPLVAFAVDGGRTSYLAYFSMTQLYKPVALGVFVLEPQLVDGESISVYTLEPNPILNTAILRYQNANPEINWTVEVGVDGTNSLSSEDAIKQLSLRLLAGEGPDIILLDGLPIDSYIKKLVLADLSNALDAKTDTQETYFTNIVNTYSRDSKLYAMPTSFHFYGAQGSRPFIEQASNAGSLASQLVKEAEAGLFSGYENEYGSNDPCLGKYRSTVMVLYSLYSSTFIKDGSVNLAALESYFSSCMALQAAMEQATDRTSLEDEPTSILLQALDSIDGYSQNGIGAVAGPYDLSALLQQQRNAQVAWRPILTSGACFEPQMTIGVNASSSYKNEADAFLRYLLSSEFQETLTVSFPVHKDAFASVLRDTHEDNDGHLHTEEDEEGLMFEMWFPDEDRSIYVYYPEEESEIMACVDLMETLSVPITQDAALKSIVLDGLVDYLNGSMTLDKALSQVQN
ncbi:MAG: extracellular solute-binding protein, partial [Coriobacteriia bacterium]|nr:extracellular solute-binding protein [Coriobacteriia bacterium]